MVAPILQSRFLPSEGKLRRLSILLNLDPADRRKGGIGAQGAKIVNHPKDQETDEAIRLHREERQRHHGTGHGFRH
jgi:hypothetical protein